MNYEMTEDLLFTNAIFNDIAERKRPVERSCG